MTFVGFGLGAIQAGLFLLEARRSGAFGRLLVSEVDPALVAAVRESGGVCVNVAHRDGVESIAIDGVELLDPAVPADRRRLVEAVGQAAEIATAVPSVAFYGGGGRGGPASPASPAAILADAIGGDGAGGGAPRVVYTAENDTRAASKLCAAIGPAASRPGFQALDTVIGKMSGVITDPSEIASCGLRPLTPESGRAVLVEEFNHILVSRIRLDGFRRGLASFQEKEDLAPFEEAKLYGHNAIHCLLGFLANRRGYSLMSEAGADAALLAFATEAFVQESGAGLLARHAKPGGDPLFTARGFAAWAEDLLARMVNPWLRDRVQRVCRDPARKLGYGDRLFGAMRLALAAGVQPVRLAAAARAGVELLAERPVDGPAIRDILGALWAGGGGGVRSGAGGPEADWLAEECVRLVIEARPL